jgi:cytochrome c556
VIAENTFLRMLISVVAITTPALVLSSAAAQSVAPSTDTRQRLVLPPAERDKVLAEMRLMLGSVSGVLQGLGAKDMATVEEAARASGIAMAADVNPQIRKRLPQTFLDLGMKTHNGFDELADQVKAGASREDVIESLATLTGNCVACHAIYRIDETSQ